MTSSSPRPGTVDTAPDRPLPRAGVADTVRFALQVGAPLLGQGIIARRPRVVGLAERLDLDARGVRAVQRLRDRHGPGPLLLAVPFRDVALVLAPDDVHRVLTSGDDFAPANAEKQSTLAHFQPHGVLVSQGARRAERRGLNETALDTPRPVHRLADRIVAVVGEEAGAVAEQAERTGQLDWPGFAAGWQRAVRRVVLGDGARDDQQLQDDLDTLRLRSNWAFLAPKDRRRRERLRRRLTVAVEHPEPGSLAALLAESAGDRPDLAPADQIPQWLFAFQPSGMAALRALALLAADADEGARVRADLDGLGDGALDAPQDLRRLRAAVLESVRLWPTTPMILRDTTTETTWSGGGRLPAGAAVVVYAPFFHRDDTAVPEAHRFSPGLWGADGRGAVGDWPLVPFSEGPGVCPGQNLVLLTTSTFLATLLEHHDHALLHPQALDPTRVPGVISPFRVRFRTTRRP